MSMTRSDASSGRCTMTGLASGRRIQKSTSSQFSNLRLISSTDANGNTTGFEYDACDRCVEVNYPDGTSETFEWSPRGALAVYTDAEGTVVSNITHLHSENIVHRDIAARNVLPGAPPSTTFENFAYDGLGRLVSSSNDFHSISYSYDSLGNRISVTQDGRTSTAVYDGVGNRLTLITPDEQYIQTTYDSLNRPRHVISPNRHTSRSRHGDVTFLRRSRPACQTCPCQRCKHRYHLERRCQQRQPSR